MILETQRLILRKSTLEDLDDFAAFISDPEVMRFSASGPLNDRMQAKEMLQSFIIGHYAQYGYGLYAAVHKVDRCFVGLVGLLVQNIDEENKTGLGYRLLPKYWGPRPGQ